MKIYTTVQELNRDPDIGSFMKRHFHDRPSKEYELQHLIGGDVFVAQTMEDVQDIVKLTPDIMAEYYVEDREYLVIDVINNNSGGPVYFIPAEFLSEGLKVLLWKTYRESLVEDHNNA